MEDDLYLRKLHQEILEIMDEIHRVCTENNLRYYLIGGTLLGAIRHHGFIPWDDDLDIVMPREDLDRFIELAHAKLRPQFQLNWITTDKNYWQFFPKISKKGTLFFQDAIKGASQTGIFVDIFPLDESPSYSHRMDTFKKRIGWLNFINQSKVFECHKLKDMPFRLLALFLSTSMTYKLIRRELARVKQYGNTHYANFGSQYSIKKQTMPKDWFGNGTLMDFENRKYVVPSDPISVVLSIFGKNYMCLPPIEKRRCHYPRKVIFSDGIEMTFDKPKHVVTFEEQAD